MTPRRFQLLHPLFDRRAGKPIMLPLIAAGLAVWINVAVEGGDSHRPERAISGHNMNVAAQALQPPGQGRGVGAHPATTPASAAPFNVAAQTEHRHAQGPKHGDTVSNPASAAPVWGVTRSGAAFVLEPNPRWPMLWFTMELKERR